MVKSNKSPFTMGRVIISVGILLRIFQIVGSYLHLGMASNAVLSACMLCFFVGGLGIFAYEHKGRTTFFSLICALCALVSTFLVGVTGLGAFANFLSVALYFLTFVAYGILVYSLGKPLHKAAGILIVLLGGVLVLPVAGVSLSAVILLFLLTGTWALMGISIYF